MEKDIHNDRLEDYVKKSFGDFEEIPSGDMWSRIEAELPAGEPARRLPVLLHAYKWQIAAAAIILLLASRLVFVQSYYEQQLRSIASQHQASGSGYSSSSTTSPVTEKVTPAVFRVFDEPLAKNISTASQSGVPAAVQPAKPITISSEASVETSGNFVNGSTASQDAHLRKDSNTVQQVFNHAAGSFFAGIPLLPGLKPVALATLNPASVPPAATPPVKPVGGGRKWYLLGGVAPGRIAERRMPAHPGSPGPVFASRSENPETATSFSLRLGRAVNRKIALEGGLAYQEMTRQTIHKPRFQFREGQTIPGGGGHHPEARSFQYDLNTYGGSASVTLRADVVGSSIPGENERVEAVIRSNEDIKLLQIPLTAVARIGEGRISGVIRAGVVGNIMVSNNFQVTAYQLDNPELKPQNDNAYTVEFHAPKHFFPGYQVALGAEYRISERLSVSAFPVITGDFPRKDFFHGGNLPGQTMLALTAAATCWF
ncbi:MAG: hypothetical protein ACKOZV_07475 [Bacteroidota bacterium]